MAAAHKVFRPGARAFITGGASGIGLAIGKLCAKHGMKVVLADLDAGKLATAMEEVSSSSTGGSGSVETLELDVSKESAWAGARERASAFFGGSAPGVDLLVLNAGRGERHSFAEEAGGSLTGAFRRIFEVNVFGYVHGLATFLGDVRAAQEAHEGSSAAAPATAIVLTGSKQGITNPPGNPAYNASKAAVKSVAEQLAFDTRHDATSVHLLVPGWTFTGMTGGGGVTQKPAGAWEPAQVADYLFDKMAAGSFYVVCPDNDVTEDLDRRRMLWAAGDAVYDRPPLSRWREDWKDKAQKGIDETKL